MVPQTLDPPCSSIMKSRDPGSELPINYSKKYLLYLRVKTTTGGSVINTFIRVKAWTATKLPRSKNLRRIDFPRIGRVVEIGG
jgi:hypothetical protein